MSGAKNTPGPWTFDPEDNSIVGKDEGLSIATIDNIDVGGEKGFHFGEESKANATLIEAAPELLQELKSMVAAYERLKPPGYPKSDAEKRASDVIAKAQGTE